MKYNDEIALKIHKEIMESFGKNIPDKIKWDKKLLIYLHSISLSLSCIIKMFSIPDCDIEKMMESILNTVLVMNANMKTKEIHFKNGKKIMDKDIN